MGLRTQLSSDIIEGEVMAVKLYRSEIEMVIETKIKPGLRRIYDMKILGFRDRHIAGVLGISLKQFLEAMENYVEMKEVYDDAMLLLCSRLREVAYERALGTDGKRDKDGMLVGPDANLAVRLLEKVDPEFREKKDISVSITIEDIVRKISQRRREAEEQAREIEARNIERGFDAR